MRARGTQSDTTIEWKIKKNKSQTHTRTNSHIYIDMFRCPPFLRSMNLVGSCYFDIIADVVASLVVAVSFSLNSPILFWMLRFSLKHSRLLLEIAFEEDLFFDFCLLLFFFLREKSKSKKNVGCCVFHVALVPFGALLFVHSIRF